MQASVGRESRASSAMPIERSERKPLARKPSADPVRRNQNGQAMGAKGLLTRRRLMDATSELLLTTPLRELTVSQITRASNTSASTFYLYFNDVPEIGRAHV